MRNRPLTVLRSIALIAALPTTVAMAREVVVRIQPGDNAVRASFRLGTTNGLGTIVVNLAGATDPSFPVSIEPERIQQKTKQGESVVTEERTLPDAVIQFKGLARYHSRPRLERYTDQQQADLIGRWESFAAASQRFVVFEARQEEERVAFYLDGHYVGRRNGRNRLKGITFDLPKTAEVRDAKSFPVERNPSYQPLGLQAIARPGAMKGAELSLGSGVRTVNGIPIRVADGGDSVDVGVVKEMKGSWALECDEHLSRTALDGMPETAHIAIPPDWYTHAWVLCAVDPAPALDPVLTVRMTRFANSGRGDAISDSSLVLPRGGEKPGPGVIRVGEVRYGEAGHEVTTPLYLVEFRLHPGEILDLLSMEKDPEASMSASPYLDFEFLGRLGGISAQWDRRHKPDNSFSSAVHVFGATLEKSPVELRLVAAQPGNVFHNEETPEMTAAISALRPCRVSLGWRIRDVAGGIVREESRDLEFLKPGVTSRIPVSLRTAMPGWFGIELVLRDEGGRELLTHDAAFASLGRDTRKAGYESPYGTWWFAMAHYGSGDKEVAGPLLFKAGLRKTTFRWSKYSEKDMAPWKVTLNQVGWWEAPKDMLHPAKAYAEAEQRVREQLTRFPHCRDADIFHESYAHFVPPELLDQKPVEDEETIRRGVERAALGNFAARFYRERFPDIRLVVGNTSSSMSIVASLLRYGLDPKNIDFIGVEAVGQTCMPERLCNGGTQGFWLAREVARKLGQDLPVTGCFEFTSRTDRNLGPRRQAEWIVRDMLLCHAYRSQHINPAVLCDAGNAYFNTLWGAGGLCRRNPLLYPKPAYVAVATLTRVLDQVKPLRRVETGSTTVYAYEFERGDGQFVYALWTACGQAELRLRYSEAIPLTLVGCYGDEKQVAMGAGLHHLSVTCDTAPVYVLGARKVEGTEIVARAFPPPPATFRVADPMDDAQSWHLQVDPSLSNPTSRELPIRAPGQFELSLVEDAQKGRCLQLKLLRTGQVPDIVGEYAVMGLRQPVPVPGAPNEVGLWVKGDSGWGKVIFEIEDAGGARWRTEGVHHDWPGDLAICHDGWRFMRFPIDGRTSEPNLSVGARWNRYSGPGEGPVRFPIKVVGLGVVMYRQALDLAEMKPVPGVLRFRDLGTSQPVDERTD